MKARIRVAGMAGALALAFAAAGPAAASANQYWLNASHTTPTTHCFTGYGSGSYTDLLPTAPTGTTAKTFASSALFGCSPSFDAGAHLYAGQGTLDVWFTNTNKKPCTTPWFLQHAATPGNAGTNITGSGANGNGSFTVPANTTTPTKFTLSINVPDTTLPPGDQLMSWIDTRTASGSCSSMTLYYGSVGAPSDISLPTLVG